MAKRGVHINVYKSGPNLWRCDLKINSSDTGGGLTARGVADEMKGYSLRHAIRGALTLAQQAVKNPAIAAAFPQYTVSALAAIQAVQTAQKAGLLGKVKMQVKDPTLKKLVRELDEMEQGKRTAMSGGGVVLCDGSKSAGDGDELGFLPIALMMAPLAKKYGPVAAKAIAAKIKARRAAKARAAAARAAAARAAAARAAQGGDDDDDDDDDELAGGLGAWSKKLRLAKKLSPTHQIAKRLLRKRRAARARAVDAVEQLDQEDEGDEDEPESAGYAEGESEPPFGLSSTPGKFGLPVGNPHPFAASIEQQIEDGAMMGACDDGRGDDASMRRLVAMHQFQRARARSGRG